MSKFKWIIGLVVIMAVGVGLELAMNWDKITKSQMDFPANGHQSAVMDQNEVDEVINQVNDIINTSTPVNSVGIANPASQNCVAKGGTLQIAENSIGQYGICVFDDNRQCEEWAMMRGDCPVGGVKITGFDGSEKEIFCAIGGGETFLGSKDCVFKNGKKCPLEDFLTGKCSRE